MGSAAETPTLSASHKMFSTFTNYFWGESEEELTQETVPRAQEVEDWIVVGEKPKDFQDSKDKSKKQSELKTEAALTDVWGWVIIQVGILEQTHGLWRQEPNVQTELQHQDGWKQKPQAVLNNQTDLQIVRFSRQFNEYDLESLQ